MPVLAARKLVTARKLLAARKLVTARKLVKVHNLEGALYCSASAYEESYSELEYHTFYAKWVVEP